VKGEKIHPTFCGMYIYITQYTHSTAPPCRMHERVWGVMSSLAG